MYTNVKRIIAKNKLNKMDETSLFSNYQGQ